MAEGDSQRRGGARAAVTLAATPVLDVLAWALGLCLAAVTRYDVAGSVPNRPGLAIAVAFAAALHLAIGRSTVYRGRYRYGSFEEMSAVAATTFGVSVLLFLLVVLLPGRRLIPASSALLGAVIALLGMAAIRWLRRRAVDAGRRPSSERAAPALVFGAGEAGHQVVRAMVRDPESPYTPVGLLDDDPGKRYLTLDGVRVLGSRDDLASAARRTRATVLLLAAPTAGAALARDLIARCAPLGLEVRVLPGTREMLGHRGVVALQDIRKLRVEDLLGRHETRTDLGMISERLAGRRVLVTGAGGSIGAEICRQVKSFGPAELVMLDRDESALHAVQLALDGVARMTEPQLVLGDIRDVVQMDAVVAERRPEVVFHAAALKHLPMLQTYPGEAVKTNVWGTLALLQACRHHGVERFVHISTDKAADPTSVLGWSKRVAERLVAAVATDPEGGLGPRAYLSVRFGNVLGSRGSVLHSFAEQIRRGGPVTVTDRAASRYFMTVDEAVELVVQASAIGRPGEALVLDMGEPVLIADLADRLVDMWGSSCEVVETGLRPGEKLHEARLGRAEPDERPFHPLISHVAVPPLLPEQARALDPWAPADEVAAALRALSESPAGGRTARSAPVGVPHRDR